MSGAIRLVGAFTAGVAGMYLLDPARGRRRRGIARDKTVKTAHRLRRAWGVAARDVGNRAQGTAARLGSWARRRPLGDRQIVERVRAVLGFLVRHPRAIQARVEDGRVVLIGPILADEVDRLLAAVRSIRGVRSIENHLSVHREPDNLAAFQGGSEQPRRGAVWPLMQRVWSPATRLFAVTAGGGLVLGGVLRGGLPGWMMGLGGAAFLVRGATNVELGALLGIGAGRSAAVIQKTINVEAPLEQVFDVWSRFENFPRFMAHVRDVRRTGDGKSHWVVSGPAGLPIEWNTEDTAYVPNQVIAWQTEAGSVVEHSGIVRFDRNQDGSTRVHIRTSWNPPGGALGYGLVAILGSDPKRALDEDLVRFKSLLEDGETTARNGRVTREQLAS